MSGIHIITEINMEHSKKILEIKVGDTFNDTLNQHLEVVGFHGNAVKIWYSGKDVNRWYEKSNIINLLNVGTFKNHTHKDNYIPFSDVQEGGYYKFCDKYSESWAMGCFAEKGIIRRGGTFNNTELKVSNPDYMDKIRNMTPFEIRWFKHCKNSAKYVSEKSFQMLDNSEIKNSSKKEEFIDYDDLKEDQVYYCSTVRKSDWVIFKWKSYWGFIGSVAGWNKIKHLKYISEGYRHTIRKATHFEEYWLRQCYIKEKSIQGNIVEKSFNNSIENKSNVKQEKQNSYEVHRKNSDESRGQIVGRPRVSSRRQQVSTGSRLKGNVARVSTQRTVSRRIEIEGRIGFG